jgi:hypothetical protein
MQYTMISGYAVAPTAHAAEVSTGIADAPAFKRIRDTTPTAHAAEVSTGMAPDSSFQWGIGTGSPNSLPWGIGTGSPNSLQWGVGHSISMGISADGYDVGTVKK